LVALSILFFEMYALCRLTGSRGGILDCLDFDRINGPPPRPRGVAPRGVPAPLAACLLALVAVGAGKLAVQDRAQLIPDRPPLAGFPLELQGWRGELDFVERWVVESLGASDQLLVDYTPPGGGPTVNLWIAYYGEQIRDAAIHSPKDCLPGGGWEYVDIRPVTAPVRRPDGETFHLNRGVIAKGEQTMLMYYWLDMRGRQITNELYQKFYNLWDSIVMRRSDGALIRLVTPVADDETVAAAEARLDAFLRVSYPHMVPHVAR
jgi:EpsI family protein